MFDLFTPPPPPNRPFKWALLAPECHSVFFVGFRYPLAALAQLRAAVQQCGFALKFAGDSLRIDPIGKCVFLGLKKDP